MRPEQARKQLENFLKGQELTFSLRTYPSGEWVAECNEIPGIITGGMGDYTERDVLMRDAIVSAAGLKGDYGYLLKFNGYKVPAGFFALLKKGEEKAYYAVK